MQVDYPYGFDGRGRTAETDDAEHVRDLIEQVLFTSPGERVNRADFGSGVLGLLFEPGGDALAATTQATVLGALQRWLGDRIVVEAVEVGSGDSKLLVTVQYVIRRSQQRQVAGFTRGGSP